MWQTAISRCFAKEREKALTAVEKKLAAPHPELDVDVNLDSLRAYLRAKLNDRAHPEDEKKLSQLVQELRDGDITTIKQLDEMMDAASDALLRYEKEDPPIVDGKPGKYLDIGVARVICSIASEKFLKARKDLSDQMRAQYRNYRGYVRKKF
jgi:hypothetical protein